MKWHACLSPALVFAVLFAPQPSAFAQQPASAQQPAPRSIRLNVTVAPRFSSTQPVTGLTPQDFTLLDNRAPRPITSFKAVTAKEEPVRVILVIDAVNIPFTTVAFVRGEVSKFLLKNDSHLAYPTTLAIVTDQGAKMQASFTTDGKAISDSLQQYTIGLRQLNRSTGLVGASEMAQICLTAMEQIGTFSASIPGRKIVIWVSPGWPILSGPAIQLDGRQQNQFFRDVVDFSTHFRQADVTVYAVNPLGAAESIGQADSYQRFVKGIARSSQVDFGDLALQVLAVQSGGLALQGSTDVEGMLEQLYADVASWYEISFEPPPTDKPDQYHHIELKLDKPNLVVRTRDGYYDQP